MYPTITIQPKQAANIVFRHPWIFSGAVAGVEEGAAHGSLVRVADPDGRVLGVGTFSSSSSIAVRLLDFTEVELTSDWFAARFTEAEARRRLMGYGKGTDTTGYRVVFGESDGMPGLIVDRYEDVLVIQIATAGMDALRSVIVEALTKALKPRAIVERSDSPSRQEEQLKEATGVLLGADPGLVEFTEHGKTFVADVMNGQKTGFFCDQKNTRLAIAMLATGKVLNLFSYSGASGVKAMANADSVLNVDGSEEALALCEKQAALNKISAGTFTTEKADIFQWLAAHKEADWDTVIMDPPALIKSRKDVEEGKKAYHFLNRAAMRLVKDGGLFVTSSCSHYLSEEDLAFTLRRASVQSNIRLDVLDVIRQSPDHPLSVYFPEAAYLKTFVCRVTR